RSATSIDEVLKQLQSLRAGGGATQTGSGPAAGTAASPSRRSAEPAQPNLVPRAQMLESAPAAAPSSPASALASAAAVSPPAAMAGEEDLAVVWRELLEAVGRASPFARNYLIEAHPVSITPTLLTIGFEAEFADHLELIDNQKTHALLHTKLSEF